MTQHRHDTRNIAHATRYSAIHDSLNPSRERIAGLSIGSLLIIMVLAWTLVLPGCADKPSLHPLEPDAVILAFGDSLTYGTGTSRGNDYPSVLEKLVSRQVINAGVPGEVSAAGVRRLPALLIRHQPDLVILCHGGNDILRKQDMAQAKQNIQSMIDMARAQGAQVVLIGVPEFGLFLDDAAIYQELADENGLVIRREILGDILRKNTLKSDHVHPNTSGYQLLAESIRDLLAESGAI